MVGSARCCRWQRGIRVRVDYPYSHAKGDERQCEPDESYGKEASAIP